MAFKICVILLIIIGLLMGSALADYSFQPAKALNSIESNNTQINTSAIDNESVRAEMLNLPLSFIENRGQVSSDVKFMVKTSHETIYLTPSNVSFALSSKNNISMVRMSFESTNPSQLVGEGLIPGTANFFIGNNSSKWVTDVPTYSSVKYESLYPGVDLFFKGTYGKLKHELMLKPGADPAKIVLAFCGQNNLSLDKNGSILIETAAGNLTDSAPFCYQDINGSRVIVEGKYRRIDDKRIGFEINNYNKSLPLVIDPLLRYSTYLGGTDYDDGHGITVDRSGNVYIIGSAGSTNFPTKNAYQAANAGCYDAFVTKLNPVGDKLVYSTYLGGSGDDFGHCIAIDGRGNAYVTGDTNSTNFPTKNAYQTANAGHCDAFVTELSPAGNTLIYSTYLGGSGDDFGNGIAIDGRGSAYITGTTNSTNFPTKNAYQAANAGHCDAFVTELSPAGNTLVYSTYLGGNRNDSGYAIAIDGRGNAYVTGETNSTNFPTKNAYQKTLAGFRNAFVAKLSPARNTLVYSTYLGGSYYDSGMDIAVDNIGNAYVTGAAGSTNFPTKNAYQDTKAGCSDAFVTKIAPAGNDLVYSTYLGGKSCDIGYGIAVDSRGDAYVVGLTPSANFPTKNAYQKTLAGFYDAFIAKLTPAGNNLIYSTFLGGTEEEWAYKIAVDSHSNAYVAGVTNSTNFPTKNAYQNTKAGIYDAFIAAFIEGPDTPSKPSGALYAMIGKCCLYSTSATDPNGYSIKYTFDWGDGTASTTGLINSGAKAFAYHKWIKAGTFQVKAMATDSQGATSGYSSALEVKIRS